MRKSGPVVVMTLLCFAGGAAAAPAVPSVDALVSANAELLASAERAEQAGNELPRIGDPAARPRFEVAFDERVLSAVDKDSLFQLAQICSPPLKVFLAYHEHGLGKLEQTTAEKDLPAATYAQRGRNALTYQNEELRVLRFAAACFELAIPATAKFWESLPEAERTAEVRQVLAALKHGVSGLYGAVLFLQPIYSGANRAIDVDVAAQHADTFASVLAPEDRRDLIRLVKEDLASAAPKERAKLQHVRAALSATACTGICAVN